MDLETAMGDIPHGLNDSLDNTYYKLRDGTILSGLDRFNAIRLALYVCFTTILKGDRPWPEMVGTIQLILPNPERLNETILRTLDHLR